MSAARRLFPTAPEPFLDLSTGINPAPYPVPALPAELWTRLPEPEVIESLQRAAAERYGVRDPAMVAAAPGTQVLIGVLPFVLAGLLASFQRRVTILGPTYAEHRGAWEHAGAEVIEVEDVGLLRRAGCAVLCNPNNPDGRRVPVAELLTLADELAGRGGVLVVDEAFADLEQGFSVAAHLPHPGILVLRSFGKAYGLAGLRLGFALAAPSLAERLRGALGPWAVSGPAAAIGTAALRDGAWLRRAAERLQRDRERLDLLLAGAGVPVIGGTRLFRLAASRQAPDLFDRLGRAGILVRRFGARPHWLRFGLPGDQAAWERLAEALRT